MAKGRYRGGGSKQAKQPRDYHDSHVKLHKYYQRKASEKARAEKEAKLALKRSNQEKIREYRMQRQEARQARADLRSRLSSIDGKNIFTLVFAILLLIALIAGLTGTENTRTFSGFLQFLTSAPKIPTDWISSIQFDWGDWGFFNFFRNFLEAIWGGLSSFVFLGLALGNAILLFVWFVLWILVGF